MDNLGTEVSVRVKEAIRAKLKEMKANSSDEIIDYIMLLVTTKKSSTELAKSIDFVMESNTTVFVKWLSTIIKKLQQVTVSTMSSPPKIINISEDNQTLKSNIKTNEEEQCSDILVCETNDVNLGDSDEEKEELKLNLNANDENIEASDEEKEESCLPKLNVSNSVKHSENKISSLPDEIKQKSCFSPAEEIKTKSYIQINKQNINKSICEMRKMSKKSHPNITINEDIVSSKENNGNGSKQIVCKRKRPRISINSDDEDEKYVKLKLPATQTTEELTKQVAKELPKKNNKNSMSPNIVKPLEPKNDMRETDKTPSVHDLTAQRVDHQRGALALDTAFKYVQQQIGASDKDIAVVKKWRDYAVETLRSKTSKS